MPSLGIIARCCAVVGLLLGAPLHADESVSRRSETCDVLVYGGTPGGIFAAVAAAREGLTVVLVEPTAHIGGMLSGGLNATDLMKPLAIGGIEKEFYERTARYYREKYGADSEQVAASTLFFFSDDDKSLQKIPGVKAEPHVCELIFEEMVKATPGLRVCKNLRLVRADVKDRRIEACLFAGNAPGDSPNIAARVFIDATYCGDLLAAAGASFRVGIESKDEFGESLAPQESTTEVQAYSYRVTLTCDPANRVPIAKPANYQTDNLDFEWAMKRGFTRSYANALRKSRTTPPTNKSHWNVLPNQKFDANLPPYHGANWEYPEGSPARREEIEKAHRDFYLSYLYFVQHDERIPPEDREEYLRWGLCLDEFADNGHFPNQLYVREGRRLVGEYVMAQHDVESDIRKPDSVGLGDYTFDSKGTQVIQEPDDGRYAWKYSFEKHLQSAYEIPYRALTPKRTEVTNLLVPVCLSSTEVAWCSLRMEPVFMRLGQAAGTAAALAVRDHVAVQGVELPQLRAKLLESGAVVGLNQLPSLER
ncbi:MAG TPA: FAD-dependent oxidoreductase [Opitutaceae bacterium]